ncbi:MAG: type II secretion system F family protein [Lachnospiraceae bacterium]|nr:type II secretion system F family protein [Lachnospiraceae bacterium]MBD5506433.1 type II secretion system F family protein [Lachnospiraceae bacterium]
MMKKTITHEAISSLCLELSLLLNAGVGSGDALALISEESDSGYKELLAEMAHNVDEGMSLSAAFRDTERFPAYVCGLVEVGEQAGHSVEALAALSRYYEYRVRLERKIRSSLLYPAVMLFLMLIVIGVLLVKVLPIFNDVYKSMGSQLTGVAGGLLNLGQWLDGVMPILWAVLIVLAVFVLAFTAVTPFRTLLLSGWRRRRGDKGLSRQMNTARIAQALSMGMSSGLSLDESVSLAAGMMEDVAGAVKRCEDCREKLEQGQPQGSALKESGLLPAYFCRLLELGMRSGAGDAAMEKIANDISEESDAALEEMVNRVEPALVLVCSVLVGLILLSVMLPLMRITAMIG